MSFKNSSLGRVIQSRNFVGGWSRGFLHVRGPSCCPTKSQHWSNNKGIKGTVFITSCAHGDTICPRPACCGPPPVHSLYALCLRRPARLAPWIFMIDRHRLVLGGDVETGLVDIHYVVTWTANQSGLVTLTFDFWPWKWSPSHAHVWRWLSLCQFWSS